MVDYAADQPPDQCVLYYSRKDELWVAHSLNTDQVATGESVLNAYIELLEVLRSLQKVAEEQKDIEVFRRAPEKIFNKANRARVLPSWFFDYARDKLRGKWPQEFEITFIEPPAKNHALKLEIREVVA